MSGFSIRLTHKIMAIGLVGLIGLLALGVIYQVGAWSQDASRTIAGEGRAISDLNRKLSIGMLEARRAEKDFQLRRDEAYSKRHAELSAAIEREMERLKSSARSSGFADLVAKVELMQRGFAGYARNFTALVQAEIKLGLNEKLGLTGSLRGAVHDIETRLKEIDDPRLTSAMLMLRRHEKDFMLRRDEKYVGELKKTAADFAKSLAGADIQPAMKADIATKLEKYQADFSAWAAGALEIAGFGAAMSKAFHDIEPVIADVEQNVERLYKAAEASEAATRSSVGASMLIAFGLAVVVVFGLSFLIGRSISRALASMISAMTKLAGGDVKVAIPGLGRRDEIGEMAGAVEVFKNSMIETERLRAEQVEIEQRQAAQRKADMIKLANAFESAVGEIVETVSSAANELEASANTLTKAAERSQGLATAVASASEEASTNVQSVSSASEELSSSVNEISRQVQEFLTGRRRGGGTGAEDQQPGRRAGTGGKPHRRRRRTHQHHRRPDQPAGAQCHHRGGARRRGRPRVRGSGI